MNGEVLPTNNGYPVRVIVPGVSGCRSVKWLDRITVQHEESPNFYQRRDYKVLPPEAVDKETAAKYWDITPALQDMPINSVIAVPQSGETIKLSPEGTIEVRGYAVPQGNHGPISKVEVSVDEGKTWTEAAIHDWAKSRGKWCWSLWKATVTLNKGTASIYSRATDKGGNTQTSNPEWNLRGVAYNGYGDAKDITVS